MYMTYDIVETHRSNIHIGDTIVVDGVLKTVGRNNISQCPFFGKTLFGDSYNAGQVLVKKAIIYRALPGGRRAVN
jgi:hypothetical protein